MDLVIGRGGRRDASNTEDRDMSIVLDIAHADPQARVRPVWGGGADQEGRAKREHSLCSSGTCVDRQTNAATNLLLS